MDYREIIFGILAVVACVFIVISIIQAKSYRRKLTIYTYLLHLNENIQKKEDFDQKFEKFENKLMDEVPKQAKQIVLYEKLKADEKNLCLYYDKFCTTKNEYESFIQDQRCDIPNEILNEIELYILPDYIADKKRQKYMLILTKISYLTAFISLIPVIKDFSKYCLLFTIYPFFKLVQLNAPNHIDERKKYYVNLIHNLFLLGLFVSDIILYVYVHYHWWTEFDIELVLTFTIFGTIFLLILKIVKYILQVYNSLHQ